MSYRLPVGRLASCVLVFTLAGGAARAQSDEPAAAALTEAVCKGAALVAPVPTERIGEPVPSIAVGVLDGAVRGWITFGASRDADAGPSVGEIWALNVHPDAWRRGVGRELVGYALGRLARAPFAEATLWTFRDTPRSRSFYEAVGFETDGATQRREASGGTIEVRYRMTLAAGGG